MQRFSIEFDSTGVRGVAPPHSDDAAVVAANFAALKRWAIAIHNFSERIEAIESAYAEVVEAHSK
jgi:hypothetical protein